MVESGAKKISVVIATYNRSQSLLRLLESFLYQGDCDSSLWECIIVNNNSSDDTLEVAERFVSAHGELDFRVVTELKQGVSSACNRGIVETRGEVVIIVDDDEIVEPHFLRCYHDFFAANGDVVCAGGRIIPEYEVDGGRPLWMNRFCEFAIASPIDLGDRVRTFSRSEVPGGGNMAFRRTALDRYGLFREDLGRSGSALSGGEETNMFSRFRSAGESIWYLPAAVTHHFIPQHRVERAYLDKLWFDVGASQLGRSRLEHPRCGTLRAIVAEGLKWCSVAAISAFYLFTLQFSKAKYLCIMRRQISRGIISQLPSAD